MKWLIGTLAVFLVLVLTIGAFLGPDDLRSCGNRPGERPPCQAADAVVAISGGDTSARTAEAIRLYQNGWAKKLVLSGAALDDLSPSNAAVMRHQALEAGVPADAILIDQDSRTTLQNAAFVHQIFKDNNIKSIILVTSAYHQRRASLEFGRYQDIEVRNHPVPSDRQWSALWWLTPGGWWIAGSEIAKIIGFYLGEST